MRKIAHTVEFCVLASIAFVACKKSIKSVYAGLTLAFLDERLQVIIGRGELVTDIWI